MENEGWKMYQEAIKLLLVEDNPGDVRLIQEMLAEARDIFDLDHVESLGEARQYLNQNAPDAILLDLGLPDSEGINTLDCVLEGTDAPVIVLTGLKDEDTALHMVRKGAQDYLVKDEIRGPLLSRAIRHAIEREEIKRRLKEAEDLYHSLSEFNKKLLENAPTGILHVNKEMEIEYVNPEMHRILGFPLEKAYDASWERIQSIPFVEETGIKSHFFERLKKGKKVATELSFAIPGGESRYLILKGVPLVEENEFTGAVLLFNDITERKRIEERLKESEKEHRVLSERSSHGVYMFQDGGFKVVNKGLVKITGYSREELQDLDFLELVHPDYREEIESWTEQALTGNISGLPHRHELQALRKDGSSIWVQLTPSLVEYNGEPAIVGSVVDITGRKKAEENLKKQKEELSDFAHTVAHDLKNYIGTIKNRAQLSLKKEETAKNNVEKIIDIAEKMENFVTQQLKLADMEKTIGEPEEIDLNELVEGMKERYDVEIERGDLLIIRGDPQRLRELFHNLIENAVTHGEATRMEVTAEHRKDRSIIFVKDNGRGIPEEHINSIFDMGYSTDGSGFGLSIVKKIVKAHGGSIIVETEEGKGTTFTLIFPK